MQRRWKVSSVIKFGTDGWRAIIAEDFTFANVARCTQGLVNYLKDTGAAGKGLVVGYDTRFLSRQFAETVASVCAANKVPAYLAREPAPTPAVSFNVLAREAAGAAIITASHNPGIWNGFKFKPEYAGSATDEITSLLEEHIAAAAGPLFCSLADGRSRGLVDDIDPKAPYLERLKSLVNLPAIKATGLRVIVDAMFGAGAGYLPELLSGGSVSVVELNGYRNPAFPGIDQPEPIAPNLAKLMSQVPEASAIAGIALDGDADRVGLVDEQGNFVSTLEVFSLLALYLLEEKGQRGSIVKGVTSSEMLNRLGQQFGVDVHEMPVGFKHIGPRFSEVDGLIGGEESGGFAFRGHIPERDGILSALYLLEYIAVTGQSPSRLVERLFAKVGPHYYHRRDLSFDPERRDDITARLQSPVLTALAGRPVIGSDTIDGRRLFFDRGWLAVRFSGTEPLLRLYCEAENSELVNILLNAAQDYLEV